MERLLHCELGRYERQVEHGWCVNSIAGRVSSLIGVAYRKTAGKVVVWVDEYDKPEQYTDRELHAADRAILKGFCGVLTISDEYSHLIFLTGVRSFSGSALFSGMNQFINISTQSRFVSICGITEGKLRKTFQQEFERLQKNNRFSIDESIVALRK